MEKCSIPLAPGGPAVCPAPLMTARLPVAGLWCSGAATSITDGKSAVCAQEHGHMTSRCGAGRRLSPRVGTPQWCQVPGRWPRRCCLLIRCAEQQASHQLPASRMLTISRQHASPIINLHHHHGSSLAFPHLRPPQIYERLQLVVHDTAAEHHGAFYSSVLGGIVTDPAFMLLHMDDHMVHQGHAMCDSAPITDGFLYLLPEYINRFVDNVNAVGLTLPRSTPGIMRIILDVAAASRKLNGVCVCVCMCVCVCARARVRDCAHTRSCAMHTWVRGCGNVRQCACVSSICTHAYTHTVARTLCRHGEVLGNPRAWRAGCVPFRVPRGGFLLHGHFGDCASV